MMSPINASYWKSIFFVPLLLLCLLSMNGCARKKNVTPPQDLAPATETTEEEKQKKDQEEKESEESKKGGKKKQGKKKGKKIPATQRPYVIEGQKYYPIPSADGYEETGLASWYGDPFHGRKTANGETYDMYGVTAAHKTLPMNTMLLVRNLVNGKTATVRINDRGPFVDGRIIDLSYTTAKELGIYRRGTGKVQIVALCAAEQEDKGQLKKKRINRREKRHRDSPEERYEEIIGALDEEAPEGYQEQEQEEREEWEPPLLAAHGKKKKISSSAAVSGLQCAVILPNGKKQRVRQDFDKGNFYIQVGSFEEKKRARKLAKVFAAQGRNVVIQEFAAAGTRLFRVLVFSSTSLKKAKQHKEELKKQGYEHAFVIARDNPPKNFKKKASKGSKGMKEKIAVN
jgi:rare lipoprotein A